MFTDEPEAHSRTSSAIGITAGGARRDRTDDLLLAKQALSQLSYGPAALANLRIGNAGREKDGGPGKI